MRYGNQTRGEKLGIFQPSYPAPPAPVRRWSLFGTPAPKFFQETPHGLGVKQQNYPQK